MGARICQRAMEQREAAVDAARQQRGILVVGCMTRPTLGRYVVAYPAFSRGGPGVALALTEDFRHFE